MQGPLLPVLTCTGNGDQCHRRGGLEEEESVIETSKERDTRYFKLILLYDAYICIDWLDPES